MSNPNNIENTAEIECKVAVSILSLIGFFFLRLPMIKV